MNPEDLFGQAQQQSERAASAVENLPASLEQFRKNLNEVYNKDNPLIKAREGQLQSYLTAGDTARRDLLPQNAGDTVFTPTELQAIVSGRQAAALAPLSSLNQLIVGQYGGLRDYVGMGRDVLTTQIQAAQQRANDLMNLYQQAAAARQQQFENQLAQQKFAEQQRQFGVLHGGVAGGLATGISTSKRLNTFVPRATNTGNIFGPTRANFNAPQTDQSLSYVQNIANEPSFLSRIWNRIFPSPPPMNTFGQQLNITGQ